MKAFAQFVSRVGQSRQRLALLVLLVPVLVVGTVRAVHAFDDDCEDSVICIALPCAWKEFFGCEPCDEGGTGGGGCSGAGLNAAGGGASGAR